MIRGGSGDVIRGFNVGLVLSTLLIFLLGVVTLYSATKGPGIGSLTRSQILYFAFGACLVVGLIVVDSQLFEKLAYPSYGICLLLLVVVLLIGKVGGGSQRWLPIGPLHIQPSEFAKIAIVFTLARFFSDERTGGPYSLRGLLIPGCLVAPLFLLILKQPDLGTAGVLFLVAGTMILFLGVRWQSLLIVLMIGVIAVPLAYRFVLKGYQRDRVLTFIDPGRDPKASGYNALQCRIAVGSGKMLGKGYLKGTQAQLNFVPEQHTDFIFSVFAEERGFVGGVLLLVFYGAYLLFGLRTVARARNKFEMLLALGLVAIVFWHVFINMGMVIGILPIVGVTLPFFSYGGSSLLTFLVATGILLNISRKRYIF